MQLHHRWCVRRTMGNAVNYRKRQTNMKLGVVLQTSFFLVLVLQLGLEIYGDFLTCVIKMAEVRLTACNYNYKFSNS